MPRKRSDSLSSASRDNSAWLSTELLSAICRIGWAPGSARLMTGSRISTGSLWRIDAMALRTSSAASIMFFEKSKISTTVALPSRAVAWVRSTPEMDCSDFSMRFTTSRSEVSGEAPGS